MRTRSNIARLHLPYTENILSVITRGDIKAAATIVMTSKYGNCEENGLVGAYIGSRFEEFKQVAFVSMVSTRALQPGRIAGAPHAFAVECKNDESSYDLDRLYSDDPFQTIYENTSPLPLHEDFDSAECYLIDPWSETVKKLTRKVATEELGWAYLVALMKVDLATESTFEEIEIEILQGKSNFFPTSKELSPACASSDTISKVCTPFTIPDIPDRDGDGYYGTGSGGDDCNDNDSSIYPGAEEIPNDGIDQDCDGQDSAIEVRKYFLFKHSGSGYRKKWAGWADKITGSGYYYEYIFPNEVQSIIDRGSNFAERTAAACEEGPALCPCAPFPDIWVKGNVELVGSFDSVEEVDIYRCDNPHYMPYNYICNMWETESAQGNQFWGPINSICGNP